MPLDASLIDAVLTDGAALSDDELLAAVLERRQANTTAALMAAIPAGLPTVDSGQLSDINTFFNATQALPNLIDLDAALLSLSTLVKTGVTTGVLEGALVALAAVYQRNPHLVYVAP